MMFNKKTQKNMKIYKLVAMAVLAFTCSTVSAQEYEYEFNPHWYVQVQGGIQHTLGELAFADLSKPNVQLGFGYNFTPVFGTRLSVNGWQSKGGSQFESLGKEFQWTWKYVSPMVDLTFDLTNLFGGFNPERKWAFGIFAGVGANYEFDFQEARDADAGIKAAFAAQYPGFGQTDLATATQSQFLRHLYNGVDNRLLLTGRFGANLDYKFNDRVSAGLELNANILNDKYNFKKANNPDWYFNALVGLKFALGPTSTKKEKVIEKPVQNEPCENVIERIIEKEVPVETVVVEPLRLDVYFTISSTTISANEQQKVRQIAQYLVKYPNANVEVSGYADKGTGNPKINQSLSEKRAEVVKQSLIKNYGIEENRIKTAAYGDTKQPYGEGEDAALNRVAICIAE